MTPAIRPGADADAEAAGLIALIGACWAEYPGCVMDLDGEVPELRALATHYAGKGGALWVAEADGAVVGVAAAAPAEEGAWEIGRMYVAAPHRGTGLAGALLGQAEAHAAAAGAARLLLWSDTRFTRAHRFYEGRSWVREGGVRALGDLSNTVEFGYAKPLGACAVRRLDVAAAGSAGRALAGILVACVEAGASVSFTSPLGLEAARNYWSGVASAVGQGACVLLAAWSDGVLVGTVQLDVGTPPNQPHRAEVRKLLVHPAARRRGVARALMDVAEVEAARAGRTLLTLDTRAGDAAEPLYRTLGWTEAGRIPGYSLDADGAAHDTLIFWKRIG